MTTLPLLFPLALPCAPLEPTSPLPACDQDASRMVKKPMTISELTRVQMKVFETDSRILHGLLRISARELGKRTKSVILPLKLLQQFITSNFPNQQEYEAWRRRNLKLLEVGLLLHPLTASDVHSQSLETCFDHEEISIINEIFESKLFVQTTLIDMNVSQLAARLAYKMFEDLPKRNVDIEKCKPTISPAIAFEVEHAEEVQEFAIIDMVEPVPLGCKGNPKAIQSLPNSSSSTPPPTLSALLQSITSTTLVTISLSQPSYNILGEMTTLKSRIEDADMVANNFIDGIPNSGQCAVADLLGDCCITSYDCSVMLKSLVKVADGNIFLALEGGYNFNSLVNPVIACAKTLLEGNPVVGSFFKERPFESTWHVINKAGIKSIKISLGNLHSFD